MGRRRVPKSRRVRSRLPSFGALLAVATLSVLAAGTVVGVVTGLVERLPVAGEGIPDAVEILKVGLTVLLARADPS